MICRKPGEAQPVPVTRSQESRSQHRLVLLRPHVAAGREDLFDLSLVIIITIILRN